MKASFLKFVKYNSLLLAILLLLSGERGVASDASIAAVVNENGILKTELNERLRLIKISSGREGMSPDEEKMLRDKVLHQMIEELLQIQMSEKMDIDVTKREIEDAFAGMAKRQNMSKEQLELYLQKHNISKETLVRQIKANLLWTKYIQGRFQPFIQVSEAEVKQAMQQFQNQKKQAKILLSEIVINFTNAASKQEAKAKINDLHSQIERGGNFSLLAQQFSQSPTASAGGDVGWVPVSQLQGPMRQAVAELKVGDVSDPLEIGNAYHLLMVRERQGKGQSNVPETYVTYQQVHFPFKYTTTENDQERIYNTANSIRQNAKSCSMLERMVRGVENAKTRLIKDVHLAAIGSPPLKELLERLQVNTSCEPIVTDEGIFIFMLCDRRLVKPQDPTLEDIRVSLLEEKLSRRAHQELRNLTRNAFIEKRI